MQSIHKHDLRSLGNRVRLFPNIPPGPPDLDARVLAHKLLCIGHYNEDVESNLFSFADLQVTTRGNQVLSTQLSLLGTWEHSGTVTDIQLADVGGGEVLLAVASSTGSLCMGRLMLPRTPGTGPEDIQIMELPTDEGNEQRLAPKLQPHKAAISSVDIHVDSQAVLTVGADGAINVFPADAADIAVPFKRSTAGCSSYTNARWADTNTFVTASSLGGLECWDVRTGPSPVSRSSKEWGPTGRGVTARSDHTSSLQSGPPQIQWLSVHPSRPNMCASGASEGCVAVWDLRFAAQPVVLAGDSASWHGGEVWEVKFDPHSTGSAASAATPGVLFCSDSGTLGLGSQGAGLTQVATAPQAFNSFDAVGSDVVAVTDAQELVYVRRQ